MRYNRDEGESIFRDIKSESRSEQNLSNPAKGQVMKLGGNDLKSKPAPKPGSGLSI